MPEDYPVSQLMADAMSAMTENLAYVIPVAMICAVVAFILQWFFYSIDVGGWVFGRKRQHVDELSAGAKIGIVLAFAVGGFLFWIIFDTFGRRK